MLLRSKVPSSRFSLPLLALAIACFPLVSFSQTPKPRYLNYSEVHDTIHLFAGSGLPGSDIADAAAWDAWVRQQDRAIRQRIDRGVEDSISNLIVYGTSYTDLPRLHAVESSITSSGEPSAEARARLRAFVATLRSNSRAERVQFVRRFLFQKGIAQNEMETFLTQNLERFAAEQRGCQEKLEQAGQVADPLQVLLTRGTLYSARSLSVDTSLLPNYALEDTLRAMSAKGVLLPGKIKRIAVIGPGERRG